MIRISMNQANASGSCLRAMSVTFVRGIDAQLLCLIQDSRMQMWIQGSFELMMRAKRRSLRICLVSRLMGQ